MVQPVPAVTVESLTKIYSDSILKKSSIVALNNVSLTIESGHIYALLGLNGAGKTTLMKIVLGLTRPTKGDIMLFGQDIHQSIFEGRVGYLPEVLKGAKGITVIKFLNYIGQICGMTGRKLETKVEQALEEFDLRDLAKQEISALSKGTLNRVGIAQALLNEPELLLLDEPTDGLDPIWRKNVRELFLRLKRKGVTILLNSHLLSEVEIVADRVGILQKGKLLAEGSVQELLPPPKGFRVTTAADPGIDSFPFRKIEDGRWAYDVADQITLEKTIKEINAKGVTVISVEPIQPKLEDVFISYISHEKENEASNS